MNLYSRKIYVVLISHFEDFHIYRTINIRLHFVLITSHISRHYLVYGRIFILCPLLIVISCYPFSYVLNDWIQNLYYAILFFFYYSFLVLVVVVVLVTVPLWGTVPYNYFVSKSKSEITTAVTSKPSTKTESTSTTKHSNNITNRFNIATTMTIEITFVTTMRIQIV